MSVIEVEIPPTLEQRMRAKWLPRRRRGQPGEPADEKGTPRVVSPYWTTSRHDFIDHEDEERGTLSSMSESAQFAIGAQVTCRDGICGELDRVVVDPVAKALTHLAVDPKHRGLIGRLVPVELVEEAPATGEIRLRCSLAEFEQLDPAEEGRFLLGTRAHAGYNERQLLHLPYYPLGMGLGAGTVGVPGPGRLGGLGVPPAPKSVMYDMVPLDEVEVHRGARVHATDGDIGRVQGLVIEPASHHVTHVLLQEGHLWGRKEVAIPITAVTWVEDSIELNLSKQQVENLPSVDIDHPVG
jgi:sporulation protein YlmC with PRC-barrel domain